MESCSLKVVLNGVRDTVWIFCGGEEQDLESLEVGTVAARDRARLRHATQLDSVFVVASRRHSSRSLSPRAGLSKNPRVGF